LPFRPARSAVQTGAVGDAPERAPDIASEQFTAVGRREHDVIVKPRPIAGMCLPSVFRLPVAMRCEFSDAADWQGKRAAGLLGLGVTTYPVPCQNSRLGP
jgi:hypothetical protein